jgi:SAM-dependent MidA family methyltransferase
MASARSLIVDRIRQYGPITFAEFMELALYHPEAGYYARATKRSGGAGDFYTSVDVGPVFGALLAEQFVQMFDVLGAEGAEPDSAPHGFDLVEAGAGNGRLSRDVLAALERLAPALHDRLRVHLVEQSPAARTEHRAVLGPHAERLVSSSPVLPSPITGVIFANELLDALPTHIVVARADALREIYVDAAGDELVEREGPPSTPALAEYLDRAGARLQPGWRAEVNLNALRWVGEAAAALERGFLLLIDYGHGAAELYSAAHAAGTLSSFASHVVEVHGANRPPWLRSPGDRDITAHVDFTSLRAAAEASGLTPLCLVDQARFLMSLGIEHYLADSSGNGREAIAQRLAVKTLLVPGGLGSTHHVMVLGKNVGRPALDGCLAKPRL